MDVPNQQLMRDVTAMFAGEVRETEPVLSSMIEYISRTSQAILLYPHTFLMRSPFRH
mgnify:CR=1 FL=1